MDPAALKARFGDRMVFWGGAIDAQHVLPSASPETVREHVRSNLDALKPGGGFVFNNVHNIQAGVPPENIVACSTPRMSTVFSSRSRPRKSSSPHPFERQFGTIGRFTESPSCQKNRDALGS